MTIQKSIVLAVLATGALALTSSQALANPTFPEGDLLIGFYQNNGTSAGANTYVFDLGASATWRENTTPLISISNIGTDLSNAFGGTWFNDPTLRWGIFSTVSGNEPNPPVNGDPAYTTYASRGVVAFGTLTASFTPSASTRAAMSLNIYDLMVGGDNKPSSANPSGAIVASSTNNDFSEKFPPTGTGQIGTSFNFLGSFGAGTLGNGTGGYGVEGALDVRRYLDDTDGADLTSGFGTGNATVGQGQYIGTFTIDSTGQLRHDVLVPEPGSIGLLAISGLALAFRRRRHNNA